MKSIEIRKTFLDFFASKQHQIVDSAPMVVKDDPTLMFTNAGMNQFKDIFLGNMPRKYARVADTQKCLRVSGKHNDLDEVGFDTYHHTMFEMLGNWSFGDYFKEEAIAWAWELLTEVYKIDKNILYVTIFGGDEKDKMPKDEEAYNFWKKWIAEDRILLGSKKDNFWEMGDTGPCGPCSEIHIDLRSEEEKKKISGKELVNKDHPQVVEVWNLVFMQFNRMANGSLVELPAKHVDTGMGFERLCMALQGKQSNYDTDVFQPLIQHLSQLSGIKYGAEKMSDVAMRVIADHVRAVSFAIADGQLPSNNKAGYVIRRILRRAVRYGYTFLNFKEPFMHLLVPVLTEQMKGTFKEIASQQDLVRKVMMEEEATFLRTLETGIRLLDQQIQKAKAENKTEISGQDCFVLYDTYGFPIDLTELILRENNMTLNHAEFETELAAQKDRSRKDAAVDTDDWVIVKEGELTKFLGYDQLEAEVEILRYRKVKAKNKEQYQLVFSQTPFYAESGGQVGDTGYIETKSGEKIPITYTKKENLLSIHLADKLPQNPAETFKAVVDQKSRQATACNHTATHLLHYALRQVLGTHVEQKGSLVNDRNLRFDFSHFQKVSLEELVKVERMVNAMIRQNIGKTENREMNIEDARKLGAMALFGEKYGDKVRVMQFGDSVELCGGTHVNATGDIGFFKILSEGAVASGIRRIEAVTAENAEEFVYSFQRMAHEMRELFGGSGELMQAVTKVVEHNEKMNKQLAEMMAERVTEIQKRLVEDAIETGDYALIEIHAELMPEIIKDVAFGLRKELKNVVFIATGVNNNKPYIHLLLGDDVVAKGLNASAIIRESAKEIGGSGGGQPFYATAGGSNENGIANAMNKIKEMLQIKV